MADLLTGIVAGTDPREQAIRIAGALAEAGVATLQFSPQGAPPQTLQARVTDLPGLLAAAPTGATLTTPNGATRLVLEPGQWTYQTNSPQLHHSLQSA